MIEKVPVGRLRPGMRARLCGRSPVVQGLIERLDRTADGWLVQLLTDGGDRMTMRLDPYEDVARVTPLPLRASGRLPRPLAPFVPNKNPVKGYGLLDKKGR